MNSQIAELYAFLRSCRGSWREAIYIECRCCPYGNPACSGYLLTADRDGAPLLFPVSRFFQLTGDRIQKEECAAVLSRQAFERLYSCLLAWKVDNPRQCSLQQLEEALTRGNTY